MSTLTPMLEFRDSERHFNCANFEIDAYNYGHEWVMNRGWIPSSEPCKGKGCTETPIWNRRMITHPNYSDSEFYCREHAALFMDALEGRGVKALLVVRDPESEFQDAIWTQELGMGSWDFPGAGEYSMEV